MLTIKVIENDFFKNKFYVFDIWRNFIDLPVVELDAIERCTALIQCISVDVKIVDNGQLKTCKPWWIIIIKLHLISKTKELSNWIREH